ncbi:MAG: MBL fold metallo-hydrolase [Candidatus Poribacteria bacterium]|nr:MBL fold metallo-hydrolase [Candidatus Poribacteria bacterium]
MILLHCGNLTIEGESSSAVATYLRVKELDLIFDLGRCPLSFIGTGHVFISHFHLDHYFGLPIYISQRWLGGIPPGEIYVPHDGANQLQEIINQISLLDCGRIWNYHLTGVQAGDTIPFRGNLVAHVLPLSHRVPVVGYLICEARDKLKPEFYGLPGKEIARLRRAGTTVTNRIELPLIAYLGDTCSIPIQAHPLLNKCQVLICECTFLLPEHRERAEKTMHVHLDTLPALLEGFESEHIVLTHFSRRYTPKTIHEQINAVLSPEDRARVQLLI